jgi:hypothetical protein
MPWAATLNAEYLLCQHLPIHFMLNPSLSSFHYSTPYYPFAHAFLGFLSA